jgi:hypothetical protein
MRPELIADPVKAGVGNGNLIEQLVALRNRAGELLKLRIDVPPGARTCPFLYFCRSFKAESCSKLT